MTDTQNLRNHRVLAEDLTPALIQQNLTTWRPDHLRV